MKLNLTTGLVPNLNVSAALLAFVFLRTWTKLLSKAGIVTSPFTRQENTIVQTCAVACYSIAVGGGFGSYLLGLNKKTYEQAGFCWATCSSSSAKDLIKLSYPSGTATAVLINGFHNPTGDKMARKQVHGFMKFFSLSFLWAFFQWFYAGGEIRFSGLKGEWFPSTLSESSMKSLNGYKVFISIALILGDGLYNFLKILYFTATSMQARAKANKLKTVPP
ncbi:OLIGOPEPTIDE TRANSPORTER YGL114W-RELATED [Salix purpurea]|uniref:OLIGOPEPTIDE TRANSPORTER YGL114W-RELATED n=1 Tax=Salix purpurea TaxID=77065 RepID=A0A9Q0VJH2_SALPP|nr:OLIGOPEPTIDE TRANSPORTER YGL114W-RELATED [Salix purpurea]